MTAVLLVLLLCGLSAASYGMSLRTRRVRAEHWLWKKQRMRRARFLTTTGAVAVTLSVAALLFSGDPV